jgi:hypothetical protein
VVLGDGACAIRGFYHGGAGGRYNL